MLYSPQPTQPLLPPAISQPDVPPAPYLPVPDYYEVKELKDIPDPQVPGVQNQNPADRVIADSEGGIDLNNTDSPSSDDAEPAPEAIFERHDGYYFGPLLGFTLPDDSAVGMRVGLQKSLMNQMRVFSWPSVWERFGTVRWEVEYSHQGYNAQLKS